MPTVIHVKTNVQLLVALVLLSAAKQAYALPAPTLISPNLTSIQQQQSSPLSSIPPTCDNHMGVVTFDDCNAAIGMFPRDQLAQPILRNFYTDPADESSMMPNVLVPMEKTYGGCTAQVLLATNFNDVPHDQSSWIDLIGPMRNILRQCARGKGTGGVLVRNGQRQNLEVVLYGANSVYSNVYILRNSDDPLAVSIAQQELLELLGMAPNVYDDPNMLAALGSPVVNASLA